MVKQQGIILQLTYFMANYFFQIEAFTLSKGQIRLQVDKTFKVSQVTNCHWSNRIHKSPFFVSMNKTDLDHFLRNSQDC